MHMRGETYRYKGKHMYCIAQLMYTLQWSLIELLSDIMPYFVVIICGRFFPVHLQTNECCIAIAVCAPIKIVAATQTINNFPLWMKNVLLINLKCFVPPVDRLLTHYSPPRPKFMLPLQPQCVFHFAYCTCEGEIWLNVASVHSIFTLACV